MGSLDQIVKDLEKLLRDADGIIDAFIATRALDRSFVSTKELLIFPYAGSTLDRVAALKHVKQELTK
jgi:hypothetical protein